MTSNVAILVPAHNEEKVIRHTLQSLLTIVPAKNIFVANDGSTDKTSILANKMGVNVLDIIPGGGKANAINSLITHFKITKKFQFAMPLDADTLVSADYFDQTMAIFNQDSKNKVACVIGRVVGQTTNWLTTYRLWEYEVTQAIHKKAQAISGTVVVCPGPSTVFRTKVFDKISLPLDTVAEDMDFTFLIHRKKLGRIAYCSQATVTTQDPRTIGALLKQLDRWYSGFWQCVFKHNVPWGGQRLDLEVALLATDGLFNGVLMVALAVLLPITFLYGSWVLLPTFVFDLVFFLLPTFALVSYKHKTRVFKFIKFLPHFYFLRVLSSFVFLKSFFVTVFEKKLAFEGMWNTPRYQIQPFLLKKIGLK